MNIHDYWPDQAEPFTPTREIWGQFLDLRTATYRGFAELEQTKGLLKPMCSLNTSEGQEMARILFYRTLEEMAESYLADDPDHIREEAVDAMNYLLSIHVLDPISIPREKVIDYMLSATASGDPWSCSLSRIVIGEAAVELGGQVGDFFRNRSWMVNAQDTYFSGQGVLLRAMLTVARPLIHTCKDFDEFARMYLAKDSVLQFRLRSNY